MPGKPGSFAAPPRGQNLFPSGRGCRGSPVASKPPFSFRLRRKENAPFDGVREKALAAQLARRASWRKCGGLPNQFRPDLPAFYRVRSTLAVDDTAPPQLAEPRQSSWGGRSQGLSFYSRAFRFAMRYPAGYRKQVTRPLATARVRQQKEEGRASGRDPDFRSGQEKIQETKPTATVGPKPP